MSVFVDASALVAIIRGETDAADLIATLESFDARLTSGIAVWEAARALARDHVAGLKGGLFETERYRAGFAITVVTIGAPEAAEAVIAQALYGKGTGHLARLNMGDCFAYACAKTNGAKLLYKGDDFIHTDLA